MIGPLAVTVLAAGFAYLFAGPALAQPPDEDQDQGQSVLPAVRVDPVRMETVERKRMVTGDLRAVRRSLVATREPGIVVELPVDEGAAIRTGDALARIDDVRLHLELSQLEADAAVAAATRDERTAELDQLRRDEALVRSAYDVGGANLTELQNAESATRVGEARLEQAERGIDVIAARRALLEDRLADTVIKAPFDAVVIATQTEVGEWIGEGDAVAELVSRGTVEAWLNVPQEIFAAYHRSPSGDRAQTNEPHSESGGTARAVSVLIDATGRTVETDQVRVLPLIDVRARNFTLIATFDNSENLIAPGMSVTAWVPLATPQEQLTVSKSAVLRNETGAFVYAVRQLGPDSPPQAMPARVRILFPLRERFAIESDQLREGDPLIVEGNERLFPTAPVRIVEPGQGQSPEQPSPPQEGDGP